MQWFCCFAGCSLAQHTGSQMPFWDVQLPCLGGSPGNHEELKGKGRRVKILYYHRTAAADGQYVHTREMTEAMETRGHEIVFVGPGRERRRPLSTDSGGYSPRPPIPRRAVRELPELFYAIPVFMRLWRGNANRVIEIAHRLMSDRAP